MKILFKTILLLCAGFPVAQAQNGRTCSDAKPFCTGTTYNFINNVNVPSLGHINCLERTPNPVWYYMQVGTSGSININISQRSNLGMGLDVDFALWGPFSDLTAACNSITATPNASLVDCSYSLASVEQANIPNAVAGQYYVLLLTNYENRSGTITFEQPNGPAGGTGATSCDTIQVEAASNSPICQGQTLRLTATVTHTQGATFSWTGPAGFSSNLQNPTIPNATPAHSGTYRVIARDAVNADTAFIDVVVHPTPDLSYTGSLAFCGTQAQLSASAQLSSGSLGDFYWFLLPGMQPMGTGANLSYNFAVPTPAQQTVLVTVGAGQCRDTVSVTLTLHADPVADFGSEDLCNGSDIRFNNLSGNLPGGSSPLYIWEFGDGQSGSDPSPTHSYSQPGTYTVTLIVASAQSGCMDTLSRSVIVHPVVDPKPEVLYDPCKSDVFFRATPEPDSSVTSFHWDLGDGHSSPDSAFQHTYVTGSYTYTVSVHTDYNCVYSVSGQVAVKDPPTLSIATIPNIITPNGDATNDVLLLDELFADCVEYELKIVNRWGSLMYTQIRGSEPFSGKSNLGGKLSAGVYFYVIKSQSEEKSGTITIAY